MDKDNNDIEIDFVIARLTTLTNQGKIYGGENVLARCDAKQTAEQVFDIFNRALTAIHTLKREIKIRQTEKADILVELEQTFIVTKSERTTMINFIYKNLERPAYIPIHLDYKVWLNDKSVGKLRELVINACEIIEMNCTSGLLEWQESIEQFPKIFDDRGDVIVGEEFQLKA
jgi:hypothetical protein